MKNNSGLDDVKMAGVKVRNPTTGFNSTYIAKNHDIPTNFTTADVGSNKSGSVNGSSPGAAFTLRGTPILGNSTTVSSNNNNKHITGTRQSPSSKLNNNNHYMQAMTTQHLLHQQLKTKQNFQMQENSAQEAMKRQPNERQGQGQYVPSSSVSNKSQTAQAEPPQPRSSDTPASFEIETKDSPDYESYESGTTIPLNISLASTHPGENNSLKSNPTSNREVADKTTESNSNFNTGAFASDIKMKNRETNKSHSNKTSTSVSAHSTPLDNGKESNKNFKDLGKPSRNNTNIGSDSSQGNGSERLPLNMDPAKQRYFLFQQQQQQMNKTLSFIHSYRVRKYIANMANLRLYELVGILNRSAGQIGNPEYWNKFVSDVFVSNGLINFSRKLDNNFKQFQFYSALLPMFAIASAELGLVRIETVIQQLITQVLSNGTIFFNCPRCTFTYHYSDGSYVTHFTQLKGIFNRNFKIEWIDVCLHSFVPGVEWSFLEALVSDSNRSKEIFEKLSQDKNQTDEEIKSGRSQNNFDAIMKLRSYFKVFKNLSIFGIPDDIIRKMQMGHVMSTLKNVMIYDKQQALQNGLDGKRNPFDSYVSYVEEKYKPGPEGKDFEASEMQSNSGTPTANDTTTRKRPYPPDGTSNTHDQIHSSTPSSAEILASIDIDAKRRRHSGISPRSTDS